jgi:hypothetical protein
MVIFADFNSDTLTNLVGTYQVSWVYKRPKIPKKHLKNANRSKVRRLAGLNILGNTNINAVNIFANFGTDISNTLAFMAL